MRRHVLNELTADQLITPTRDGWWDDGGKWRKLHYHMERGRRRRRPTKEWNGCFQGIMQCNYVIEDLDRLSPEQFGFTDAEFNNIKTPRRVLRALGSTSPPSRRFPPLALHGELTTRRSTAKRRVEPSVISDFMELRALREQACASP